MKELEMMYELEMQKATRDRIKEEIEYNLKIENLTHELENSKKQMLELKEQTTILIEHINSKKEIIDNNMSEKNNKDNSMFIIEKQKTAELRLEIDKLDKDIDDLLKAHIKTN